MNVGLIGYGAWGRHHAAAITETEGLHLSAICSQSDQARTMAAERHKAATFADYRELLAQPDLDAVDIVLPTHLHHEVTLAALDAGMHVLLEKPMASNPGECAELIDKANAAGKVLYV